MSDRELLENLAKISERCRKTDCTDCKFCMENLIAGHYCAIAALADFLAASPCDWNFNDIENVLNEIGE